MLRDDPQRGLRLAAPAAPPSLLRPLGPLDAGEGPPDCERRGEPPRDLVEVETACPEVSGDASVVRGTPGAERGGVDRPHLEHERDDMNEPEEACRQREAPEPFSAPRLGSQREER